MSWDVIIFSEQFDFDTVESLPNPLGQQSELKKYIERQWKTTSFYDASSEHNTRGYYSTDDFTIEVSLGQEDTVEMIYLYVRGGGDPVGAIASLCLPRSWAALDVQNGEFIDLASCETPSFTEWQAFRDATLKTYLEQ